MSEQTKLPKRPVFIESEKGDLMGCINHIANLELHVNALESILKEEKPFTRRALREAGINAKTANFIIRQLIISKK